jgi:hypothetical protein
MTYQPFQAGNHIEYLVAAVFQGEGYLVRRAVPLKIADDVTNIDILGIKFTKPFQPHRIICDCKDRRKSKPYERIIWAKGLSSFVNASETYVALPRADWKIFNFARSGQVRVFTHKMVDEAFRRIYGEKNNAYGLANEAFYEPFYRKLTSNISNDPQAKKILFRTRTLLLVEDPYVALNIAMSDLKITAITLSQTNTSSFSRFQIWRYLAADLIVAISLLLLFIASDIFGLSKIERERHILDRVTYGDVSPEKAKKIFSLARDLSLQATRALIPDFDKHLMDAFDIREIDPPYYAPDIYGLIERIIQSPELYHELPQLLDYLLFELSLQNKGFLSEEYSRSLPTNYQENRLKVARNILSFVRDACGLNLEVFWPKEIDHLPKTVSRDNTEVS